jgi:hypothetical protein
VLLEEVEDVDSSIVRFDLCFLERLRLTVLDGELSSGREIRGTVSWDAGSEEANVLERVAPGFQHADHVADRDRVVQPAATPGPRLTGETAIARRFALIGRPEAVTLHHADRHAADCRDRFGALDGPARLMPLVVGTTKDGCSKAGGAGEREAREVDALIRSVISRRTSAVSYGPS